MRIPRTPPTLAEILQDFSSAARAHRLGTILMAGIGPAPEGKYRHWETLRHVTPPEGLTADEWWAGIKWARAQLLRPIPLRDTRGRPFHYAMPDPVLEMLHAIDRDATGHLTTDDAIANPHTRNRYVQSSLIEEAITSSQLEGASTTRDNAKAMIRSGRAPVDTSEQMILNNYRAMQLIREYIDKPLSREMVVRIHRVLTEDTGVTGGDTHAMRQPGDGIKVFDNADGKVLHDPPDARQLPERIEQMCAFANSTHLGAFMHPVVKAIILHFWLAYDHPFVDGNGRTARGLFYWSMLSQGYWLFEYLSISRILVQAPTRYARSFLYCETDENDLTYFILAQLRVICRAIDDLQAYLARKADEARHTERLLRASAQLNHRQIALLGHALRHPGFRYAIAAHQASHRVTYQTARADLLDLAEKGLLEQTKSGRQYVFVPVDNLQSRLQALT